MTANQALYPIGMMARMLGVSRSGFYAWRTRMPSRRAKQDAVLTETIRAYHTASKKTYGSPRIHADLLDDGIRVGRKRVERLMKAAGLRGAASAGMSPRPCATNAIARQRIWSIGTSMPMSRTRPGLPTSPMSRPVRALSISRLCLMPSVGGSWAGPSGMNKRPNSSCRP